MYHIKKLFSEYGHYLALVALWAILVLPSTLQNGFFYVDDPDQLLMAKSGAWWVRPNLEVGRHIPVFQLYRKLVFLISGPSPFGYYLCQSLVILATWTGILWLVRRLTAHDGAAQWITIVSLICAALSENAYTLGKHESLLGLLFVMTAIVSVLYFESDSIVGKIRHGFFLLILVLLAKWNKETSSILPLMPLLIGLLWESTHWRNITGLLRRFATTAVPAMVCVLALALAKIPTLIEQARQASPARAIYTTYEITSGLIFANARLYLIQSPDLFAKIAIGALLLIIFAVWKRHDRARAVGAAMIVMATAYLCGMCFWRFSIPYYLYPASLFAAMGLGLLSARTDDFGLRASRVVAILLIPIQLVALSQTVGVAAMQTMGTRASQVAIGSLIENIKPEQPTNIFLLNFQNPSEPPEQLENIVGKFHGRNVRCFGAWDLIEHTRPDATAVLFQERLAPKPGPGDYLVYFTSEMEGPWHLRGISPSRWTPGYLANLGFETESINASEQEITLPILSWKTLPHMRRFAFGTKVLRITGMGNAGTWTGRWADKWVEKKSVFTPFSKVTRGLKIVVASASHTTPNALDITREGKLLKHLDFVDSTPVPVDIPAGEGALIFVFENARSPKSARINDDTREIAGSVDIR